MDRNGNIAETYNYDAWGRRRNPEDWTYNNVPEPQFTRVGYTGHEHWDEHGLINMTGRIYDPHLARFLSPDPYVQMPDNTQNLNRYSYCLNNPLIYTDPSGEKFKEFLKKAGRQIYVTVVDGVIILYVATCTGVGLAAGVIIGTALGPDGTALGGVIGAGLGLYLGAKSGLWLSGKNKEWVGTW